MSDPGPCSRRLPQELGAAFVAVDVPVELPEEVESGRVAAGLLIERASIAPMNVRNVPDGDGSRSTILPLNRGSARSAKRFGQIGGGDPVGVIAEHDRKQEAAGPEVPGMPGQAGRGVRRLVGQEEAVLRGLVHRRRVAAPPDGALRVLPLGADPVGEACDPV